MNETAYSQAIFAPGVPPQEKQDVSDLLLQADVFASTTWDRKVHWQSWLDYHANRLKIRKPPWTSLSLCRSRAAGVPPW